tara:strand:- start:153 stop:419 length:267 start_codon:yes stop_codon:yes gene_type:complete
MSAETLSWIASLTGICAALLVALDAGKKVTGAGFLIFALSSICWIWAATMEGESPLAIQNTVLLGINLLGIYRYLWRPFAQSRRLSLN